MMKRAAVAAIGAGLGAVLIHYGLNFRVGGWWVAAPEAYAPAMVAGGVIALVVLWAYERSSGRSA